LSGFSREIPLTTANLLEQGNESGSTEQSEDHVNAEVSLLARDAAGPEKTDQIRR
jgi:hypothetical protein